MLTILGSFVAKIILNLKNRFQLTGSKYITIDISLSVFNVISYNTNKSMTIYDMKLFISFISVKIIRLLDLLFKLAIQRKELLKINKRKVPIYTQEGFHKRYFTHSSKFIKTSHVKLTTHSFPLMFSELCGLFGAWVIKNSSCSVYR